MYDSITFIFRQEFRRKILNSNTTPLSQNRFQYHPSPLFPLHGGPYLNLFPTHRTGSGGPSASASLCPRPAVLSCFGLQTRTQRSWKAQCWRAAMQSSSCLCCISTSVISTQPAVESSETFVLQEGMMRQWCFRSLTWVLCKCTQDSHGNIKENKLTNLLPHPSLTKTLNPHHLFKILFFKYSSHDNF